MKLGRRKLRCRLQHAPSLLHNLIYVGRFIGWALLTRALTIWMWERDQGILVLMAPCQMYIQSMTVPYLVLRLFWSIP